MEETTKLHSQPDIEKSNDIIIEIGSQPIMESALEVLGIFGNKDKVILKSKGDSIPNAVAVANIIIDKMLKAKTRVEKINLDTVDAAGIGSMTSTVEIILIKI